MNTSRKKNRKRPVAKKSLPLLSINEQRAKAALADLLEKNRGALPRVPELAAALNLSIPTSYRLVDSLREKGHYREYAEVVA